MNLLKNRNFKIVYEIGMALLAIGVVVILVIDLSYNLPQNIAIIFSIIDNMILGIFAIDYFTRLFLAKDKAKFVKSNIIDLISIIPFNFAFQSIRILRLSKLLKFVKLFRAVSLILKFKSYIDKFLKTNNFNYVIWITLFTLFLGAIGIHFAEDISIGNALWWSFVTITTVGYGDISPGTTSGRIIAGIIMIVGIGFLGMLTATIATFFLNRNNSTNFKNQTIEDIKTRLDNFDELNIEDIDDIYNVLRALKK
ncbi:potassium channel family protein [Clostridium vincentii]|uniref:pH-gated potassium channel KcsA n=1 Tax=Clostridium vincentii TaxID=52704 RepID=A0A2T0BJM0_9CLOT|nr:potassium channel family protein [Clostridium vincentii]PRR84069.1 pH-gated potassium channel KcsA [Clostridium vincentii]